MYVWLRQLCHQNIPIPLLPTSDFSEHSSYLEQALSSPTMQGGISYVAQLKFFMKKGERQQAEWFYQNKIRQKCKAADHPTYGQKTFFTLSNLMNHPEHGFAYENKNPYIAVLNTFLIYNSSFFFFCAAFSLSRRQFTIRVLTLAASNP